MKRLLSCLIIACIPNISVAEPDMEFCDYVHLIARGIMLERQSSGDKEKTMLMQAGYWPRSMIGEELVDMLVSLAFLEPQHDSSEVSLGKSVNEFADEHRSLCKEAGL